MKKIILFLSLATVFYACDVSDNSFEVQNNFQRIYDDGTFETEYIPINVVSSGDSGYFILGAYDKVNVYLLKVDKDGEFQWDYKVDDLYINPIPGLFELNGAYYFMAMANDNTTNAVLMSIPTNGSGEPTVVRNYGNIELPLASALTGDGSMLVMGYDKNSYATTLHLLDAGFNEVRNISYSIDEDAEPLITNHIYRLGKRQPFFVGSNTNNYHFNGLQDYTLSFSTIDKNSLEEINRITGFRDEKGINCAVPLQQNEYAIGKFEYQENSLLPKYSFAGNEHVDNLTGNFLPEMDGLYPVVGKKIIFDGEDVNILGTTTKAGQILLYAYSPISGNLQGTYYQGVLNPYSLVDFVQTEDEGLAILGNTFVNGRFSRITLFKLSKEQTAQLVYNK